GGDESRGEGGSARGCTERDEAADGAFQALTAERGADDRERDERDDHVRERSAHDVVGAGGAPAREDRGDDRDHRPEPDDDERARGSEEACERNACEGERHVPPPVPSPPPPPGGFEFGGRDGMTGVLGRSSGGRISGVAGAGAGTTG